MTVDADRQECCQALQKRKGGSNAGTTTAEEFIGPRSTPTTLVARRRRPSPSWRAVPPTYARDASGRCWRRLPASDPRTLENVGIAFPYGRVQEKALPPRRGGHSWIIRVEDPNDFWFLATQTVYRPTPKRIITYTVDAKSGRIRSISIQALKPYRHTRHPKLIWLTARLRPVALSARPTVPNPTPDCQKRLRPSPGEAASSNHQESVDRTP